MKRSILVLCILLMLIYSCKKELSKPPKIDDKSANSTVQNAALTGDAVTKYGLLISGDYTNAERIKICNNLGVNYVRSAITMSDYTGNDFGFEQYTNAGFHILWNINNEACSNTNPAPFVTDIASYKKKLTSILTRYKPEVAVIENEETNRLFHTGTMVQYITQLRAATSVAHAQGVKVANGGIHPLGICYFVWKDYKDRGMNTKADDWMNRTFNSTMKYAALHPEKTDGYYNTYWRRIDTLLNAYTTLDIDYVNLHIYESVNEVGDGIITIPGCIETMASYVRARTGKEVMTNECGQHNLNGSLVTSMLKAFSNGGYRYAIWYSGDGNKAVALTNANGSLRLNGVAYTNYMAAN